MMIAYWATNAKAISTGSPTDPEQYILGILIYCGMLLALWTITALIVHFPLNN